jgi:2-dehydro-3-deoxygluconokinase
MTMDAAASDFRTDAAEKRACFFGECMIELADAGHSLFKKGIAGDTYNTAVYFSRLAPVPWRTQYAAGVSDDRQGIEMLDAWAREGVEGSLARKVPDRSLGLYMIKLDASGERYFSYWRDHSAARAYFDVDVTPLEQSAPSIGLFYLSGISVAILPPRGRERLLALVGAVRRAGGRVAWDNNYRPRLWSSHEEAEGTMRSFLLASDIALVTVDDEIALRGGHDADRTIKELAQEFSGELILRRGSRPTIVRNADGKWVDVPAQRVPVVVDTTAAGDSFSAAYLANRVAGHDPVQSAQAGNRLAAIVVQHPGAIIPKQVMAAAHVDSPASLERRLR